MEGTVYRCTKAFSVDLYDDNECSIENEVLAVPEGSIWEYEDDGSLSDIRLYRVKENGSGRTYSWLDIPEEALKQYFEEV